MNPNDCKHTQLLILNPSDVLFKGQDEIFRCQSCHTVFRLQSGQLTPDASFQQPEPEGLHERVQKAADRLGAASREHKGDLSHIDEQILKGGDSPCPASQIPPASSNRTAPASDPLERCENKVIWKTLLTAKAALENDRKFVQGNGSEDDANLNHDAIYHVAYCLRTFKAPYEPHQPTL